jgi:TRAP-type C4-dicarboxylate transport system substrate-binding protein
MVLLIAVCFIALALSGITTAQQGKVIELGYGTPYAIDYPFSVVDKKWMAKVEKKTNGRLKFKPYWGGAVIGGKKDAAEELAQGATDIAFINPSTSNSGFQITKTSMIFFYGANLEVGGRVFKELLTKAPEIGKEYKGIKVLCWGGCMTQLITRKPVRKTADLKGMRIKALGDVSDALKE